MRVCSIVHEDFLQYKKASMFIISIKCDWKCCIECGEPIKMCQNNSLNNSTYIYIDDSKIYDMYISNKITSAIVVGGLEPFLQFEELYNLIKYFRDSGCNDDFVIYTGYYKDEIENEVNLLSNFCNIYIKFGRFIPYNKPHFDEVIGVFLSSDNQYGEKIS